MVASSSGKMPKRQMTAAEKKLQLEVERRERRIRRDRLAKQRPPSIKVRAALQKAASEAKEAAAEAKETATSPEASSRTGPRRPSAEPKGNESAESTRRLTPKPAAKSLLVSVGPPRSPISEAMDDVVARAENREDPGPGESDEADSTQQDEVEAVVEPQPTSPPTSHQVLPSDLSSRPTLGRPPRARKRRHSQVEEQSAEPVQRVRSADRVSVTAEDPCYVEKGGTAEDTALDSESDDSPSDGDDDIDELEQAEADWELTFSSDEDEEDVAEPDELPSSRYSVAAHDKKLVKEMRQTGWNYDSATFGPDPAYAGLYEGPYGPTDAVLEIAEDPLALFFSFMPPKLWRKIEEETNRYHMQTIDSRAREIRRTRLLADPEYSETLPDIKKRLRAVRSVEVWEILRVVGLLIARMLAPQRRGMAAHWSRHSSGAIPLGTFGQWLPRNRFEHVMQNLHFTDNQAPQAQVDRGWKVRSVVSALQKTFQRGYKIGPVIAFDEAMIPTRARRNPMRQYLPNKPHKWGTKFFSACCGHTAYCMMIEMYVDAKTNIAAPLPADNSSGAAAVMRSMNKLLPPYPMSPYRIVVTDRFYTSVTLALELLHRRLYFAGTIQTKRSGYADGVITKKKLRKGGVDPPRGTLKIAENKMFPEMTAAMWMDNNPVHMLATGGSRVLGPVYRRVGKEKKNFPAPGLVRDYQRWMGGVDIHDQLRMQRYSVQLAYKPRKYYRSIFFGLVDMALVNAFIVHRYHLKTTNQDPPEHYKFLRTLHEQLLAIKKDKFEEIEAATTAADRTVASPQTSENEVDNSHYLAQCPDKKNTKKATRDGNPGKKRIARSCKVCAVYRVKPRKYSKYYCPYCSSGELRKHLCNVARGGALQHLLPHLAQRVAEWSGHPSPTNR